MVLLLIARQGRALIAAAAAISLVVIALAVSWIAFASGRASARPDPAERRGVSRFSAWTMPLLLLLTDRERQFVRRAFDRYLAPALVERLAENPAALTLGGETRELTILFPIFAASRPCLRACTRRSLRACSMNSSPP
jgi:adenylate cyclase